MSGRYRRLALLLGVVALFLAGCHYEQKISLTGQFPTPMVAVTLAGSPKAEGKVALIEVQGFIGMERGFCLGSCEPAVVPAVVARLKEVESDGGFAAVLLKFNTPGGSVTASDILYQEIAAFKERTGLPVIAYMEGLCASGGVYAAMAADRIIAHPTTITGSIGVILQQVNIAGLLDKIGVDMTPVKSGDFKDMGSPFRSPTPEENALMQDIIAQMHQRFADTVAAARHLPREEVDRFADGRVFLAHQALEYRLIDGEGAFDDAFSAAAAAAGRDKNDLRLVAWRTKESYQDTVYGPASTGATGVSLAAAWLISRLDGLDDTGLYYLWPAWITK